MKKFTLILLVINIFTIGIEAQTSTQQRTTASEIVVEAIPDQVYTGAPLTPDVVIRNGQKTLVKGTDYTLSYSNNREMGKATVTIQGKGNYADTKDVYFNIVSKSLQIDPIADQTYQGEPISPSVIVKDGTKTLVRDRDYTVSYTNNINVGTASITITGKGTYTETKQVIFKIVARSMKDSRATPPPRSNEATTQTSRQQTTRPSNEATTQTTRTTQQTTRNTDTDAANADRPRTVQTFNKNPAE
ncbi:MAG: hypothetical protein FWD66_04345 [Paludibacter sp.]|nr:hypothetical protein [Paludibacter sp.]